MTSYFSFGWNKKKTNDTSLEFLWNKNRLIVKASYQTLFEVTDGFSSRNLLGVGSFGSVYKGILDGEIVAVKVLKNHRQGASKSFMAECEALGSIRHRNLVKLITACSTIDFQGNRFRALIYRFMPFGNLDRWLHSNPESNNRLTLNLRQRINIAIDVAYALEYLHHYCPKPIIHCDLKPSNILLDTDLVAHVGDFGLAKFLPEFPEFLPEFPDYRSLVRTRGTTGYAAPEYGHGKEVSIEGDIYSYGILLLEMITGKKPTDRMFEDDLERQNFAKVALPGILLLEVLTGERPILDDIDGDLDGDLHSFARNALPDRVMEIVDPILLKDIKKSTEECLISMVRIGVACSMESPENRIEIKMVIRGLNLIKDILEGTQRCPNAAPLIPKSIPFEDPDWVSLKESYSQDEVKSDSTEKSWLPNFENLFFSQEESWLPNVKNSLTQDESLLPNVKNSLTQDESLLPNFENYFSPEELQLPSPKKSYISSSWVIFE